MLGLILLVFAFVCFCIAAGWPWGTVNIGWAGAAFVVAAMLFGGIGGVSLH